MKRIFLASAGILALGGVANASGWPPMLQKNGQELYAAPLDSAGMPMLFE